MKLYYTPGACSLAPHIAAREAGVPLELEKVDLGSKKTAGGSDYLKVNPKGYVPALALDDGTTLTEAGAILQYLGDRAAGLMPPAGSMERYREVEWITFISSEIHKGFGPLWDPSASEEVKKAARERLAKRLAYVDQAIAGRDFLMGSTFTVADAYLFTILNWSGMTGVDLSPHANLQAFQKRVGARPKVQEALRAEGLLK